MCKRLIFGIAFLFSPSTFAVCPLCAFAASAGIGLSEYLGIDDTVTGVWLGGLIVSLIIITNNWFKKRRWDFYGYRIFVGISYYVLTLLPLYLWGISGHILNKLWGMDKLLLGVTLGSLTLISSNLLYQKLKEKNKGRAYFPFQKVVMPLLSLMILSCLFCIITQ